MFNAKYLILACFLLASGCLASEQDADSRVKVNEEIKQITKSLEVLIGELGQIKSEAVGRLSNVKSQTSSPSSSSAATQAANPLEQRERIRQTKVSRFVLRRVAELESESKSMRDELNKLFELGAEVKPSLYLAGPPNSKQEDHDFDDAEQTTSTQATRSTAATSNKPATSEGLPASTSTTSTTKPTSDEAAQIGFDMEALKKLGTDLERQIEVHQQANPESMRGVHEQVIKLVDNMVQVYLGNVRRTVQRMTNLLDSTRRSGTSTAQGQPRLAAPSTGAEQAKESTNFEATRESILARIQTLTKSMHDFSIQWAKTVGKQQSPLLDRIPPRGVELWRDFWDTVRRQVRRINQEFSQLSQDMTRLILGRTPSRTQPESGARAQLAHLSPVNEIEDDFYQKLSLTLQAEQKKMDALVESKSQARADASNLIDEADDESTKAELTRNVALRQQIQGEIDVFGSIFDIMRAFIQQLRQSATGIVRDVMRPGSSINNNNDAVTPGPSIKPQVDKLLDETIEDQRNINSQSKPVLLPNVRPALNPKV